nr:long chain base biosynthesis protein 1-like [Tanacetum cinerariifolium]
MDFASYVPDAFMGYVKNASELITFEYDVSFARAVVFEAHVGGMLLAKVMLTGLNKILISRLAFSFMLIYRLSVCGREIDELCDEYEIAIHQCLLFSDSLKAFFLSSSCLLTRVIIRGKGFSEVETPLFEGMLVEQEIDEEGDADEHVEKVNTCDVAHGDDSAAHREVSTVTEEPSIPSPTPPTPPPQPPQDIPSTSQVQQTPPQSPQVYPPSPQPQPQQAVDFPMSLLQEAMDACAALTRRVENLEYDKVSQALEITKLKRRVKNLKKRNKVRVLKLRRLQRVGTSQRVETTNDTVMDDESNQERMIAEMDQDDVVVLKDDKEEDKKNVDAVNDVKEAKADESAQDQGRQAESQAEIYKIDVVTTAKLITEVVTAASETVTAVSAIVTVAEAQVPAAILTAAPARIVVAPKEPKPLKKKQQIELDKQYARELHAELNKDIDWDEVIDHVKRKAKKDPTVKRYQVLKRKPQIEAQARNNMIMYLKNVAGFKMDYFKGMSYDDIQKDENRALQKLNETPAERAAKMRKLDEEVEELRRHLQIVPNEDDNVYTEATPLARKVPVVDYQIIKINNKPYYKIIRADDTHQLYISFLSLLRNFDREDLEALWRLVKERFSTTNPKNFSEDFLLVSLRAMFEKPDIHAQIWKTQRNEHGPAKVKGWKLLKSCGAQIITFISTQLILLVEKKYPFTRFILDQMLNTVRLEVEEESEVSLELLRFIRQ